MENERKQRLIKYIFCTEEIRSFLCDDFFMEIMEILPKNLCISAKNCSLQCRKNNYAKVKSIISDFVFNNKNYQREIFKLFKVENLEQIINNLILGYVFFWSNTYYKYFGVDIFRDKRSICYSPVSIIDVI